MSQNVHCAIHGDCRAAYVCSHLLSDAAGLGFHRNEPAEGDAYPDAWCDDCELIRAVHGGWNEESEKLVKISLLCSVCYNRARIRNTRTEVTLDDLANLRWKCGSCEEWHYGPCLDFGYSAPFHWREEYEEENGRWKLGSIFRKRPKSFLTEDFCAMEDEHFFVRGIISLPIIGTAESLRWGVWGSLSRDSFQLLQEHHDDPHRDELEPMFSWLSTRIGEYSDTLNLKMYAHVQPRGLRPEFELQHTEHPLAQECHHGITPQRVKEIMLRRLGAAE